MKKSKFSEEQIAYALRQAESGHGGRRRLPAARRQRSDVLRLEEEVRAPGRERAAPRPSARGRECAAEAPGRRPDARQAHARGGPPPKKSEAHTAAGAGRVVPRAPSRPLSAARAAGAVQSGGVVSPEPGPGSDRAAAAHSGARARAAAVRLLAHLGAAAAGGLAGESEARAAALSPRRPAAADAGAAAQAHRAASRAGADPGGPDGALEHGLRARCARRRAAVSRAHRRRSVESPESVAGGGHQRCRGGPSARRSIACSVAARCPRSITVDHGTEFMSRALEDWAYQRGVQLDFIRPGKPVENAFIESFNGRLRDECLNVHQFISIDDAQAQDRSLARRLQSATGRTARSGT